jgi:hypothetical protein
MACTSSAWKWLKIDKICATANFVANSNNLSIVAINVYGTLIYLTNLVTWVSNLEGENVAESIAY